MAVAGRNQIQASSDGDFLRAIAAHTLQRLMEFEVDGLIGAGHHERSDERTTYRNGYRDRQLETRLGTLDLKIPKLRQGSYFPEFLEPRRTAEKALAAGRAVAADEAQPLYLRNKVAYTSAERQAINAAKAGRAVSLVVPARNEAATVGDVVSRVREALVDTVALLDEARSALYAVDRGARLVAPSSSCSASSSTFTTTPSISCSTSWRC